jgi:hypothetical protein
MRTAVRNAEDALDAADRATNASADRAADHCADRPRGPAAFTRALMSAALHAADHTLGVGQMRNGQKRQGRCGRHELKPH